MCSAENRENQDRYLDNPPQNKSQRDIFDIPRNKNKRTRIRKKKENFFYKDYWKMNQAGLGLALKAMGARNGMAFDSTLLPPNDGEPAGAEHCL